MTTQEIKSLPIDEKVRIMEAIWEDMRGHYEESPISKAATVLSEFTKWLVFTNKRG